MFEYKGYLVEIEHDGSNGMLHGRVINVRDTISFEIETAHGARLAFERAVDDYLAFCAERGEEPERPST